MTFPFKYHGRKKCGDSPVSDVGQFQGEFLRRAKEKLEIAKTVIVVDEKEISFRTTARAFPYWFNKEAASLVHIPKGTISFDSNKRTINYILNFNKSFAIYSVGILGVFGSFFTFVVEGPWLIRIAIVFFMWLSMMSVTYVGGIIGFKQFVNRILREMKKV